MRGGRRPAEWAVFYSKPPSPIRNRDLHNGRGRSGLAPASRARVRESCGPAVDTIVSRVLHFADSRPEAIALIEKGKRLTYGGRGRRVRATAAWLHRAGVQAGDTVAVSFDAPFTGSLRSLQFFYALASLGAVVLPLYPDVPIAERLELVARFRARWLIPRHLVEASAKCSLIDPAACDWRACERDGAVAPRGDEASKPFMFHFSGDTTATPKILLFDHGQYLTTLLVRCGAIGATTADRLVPSRPWATVPGLRYVLTIHSVGGTFVNASFPETSQELRRLIGEVGATVVIGSPWQLRRLLASASSGDGESELRVLYVAGAFISPAEIQAAREAITRNVYVSYACTEVALLALLRPGDPVGPAGTVGRLVAGPGPPPADDEHRPPSPGTVGHLGFPPPWIPPGYARHAKATAEHFHDGWFYPGHVGAVDSEGQVSLRGRSDDVINYGGLKLQPEDIEAVLTEHPDIEDAAAGRGSPPTGRKGPRGRLLPRPPRAPPVRMALCA